MSSCDRADASTRATIAGVNPKPENKPTRRADSSVPPASASLKTGAHRLEGLNNAVFSFEQIETQIPVYAGKELQAIAARSNLSAVEVAAIAIVFFVEHCAPPDLDVPGVHHDPVVIDVETWEHVLCARVHEKIFPHRP